MKSFQFLTTTIITASLATGAYAAGPVILPTGGKVTSGSATIGLDAVKPATLDINQSSSKVNIDWDSFSSSTGATINFNQKASDIAINRVTGNQVSTLNGLLNAQGKVVLINENGVVFGKTSQTNVGALSVIAAKSIGSDNGVEKFSNTVKNATIENQGKINATGDVTFFASNVSNKGTIVTNTNPDIEGDIQLLGNKVENTGTLSGNFVGLTGTDTIHANTADDGQITLDLSSTGGKTINARGTIKATSTVALGDTVTAQNAALAKSTINLTGVIDSPTLVAAGSGDVNYATTSSNANYTSLSGNNVNVTAGSVINSSYATDIRANSNANIAGTINTSRLEVGSNKDINYSASTTATTSSLDAKNDINFSGNIKGGNDTKYTANEYAKFTAGRDVNLKSGSSVNVGGHITDHLIDVTAGRNIIDVGNLQTTSTQGAQHSINFTAANDVDLIKGSTVSSDLVNITASNDINTGARIGSPTAPITTNVNLQAGNNIFSGADSRIFAGGNVEFGTSNGSITLNGRTSSSTAEFRPSKDINFSETADVDAKNIGVYATNNIGVYGKLNASGTGAVGNPNLGIEITTNGNIAFGAKSYVKATNGIDVHADGKLDINGFLFGETNVNLFSTNNLSVNTKGNVTSKVLTVLSDADINIAGGAGGNDYLSIKAPGNFNLPGSVGNIDVTGQLYSKNLTVNASGNLTQGKASEIYSGGPLSLYGAKQAILAGTISNSIDPGQAGLNIGSGGDVDLSGANISSSYNGFIYQKGGNVSITAGNHYLDDANTKIDVSGLGDAGGNISIHGKYADIKGSYAARSAFTNDYHGGTIKVTTDSNYVDASSSRFDVIGENGGTLDFTSGGNLNLNGLYDLRGSNDTYPSSGGTMNVLGTGATSKATIAGTIEGASTAQNANVNIHAPSIDISHIKVDNANVKTSTSGPAGGLVTIGTVGQNTTNQAINWSDFDIGGNDTSFSQGSSVAVNQITTGSTVLQGSIQAAQ